MTIANVETTIEILGKPYQIKCPESEIASLQKAAHFLEEKMREIRSTTQVLSIDRIAVIAALNLAHQLLNPEQTTSAAEAMVEQRLQGIYENLQQGLAGAVLPGSEADQVRLAHAVAATN